MFSFSIQCLERHILLVDDIVTVSFLAIIPRDLVWERESQIEWFGIFVNVIMKPPFEMTRAFLEFNRIFLISFEETIQLAKNGRSVRLVWMWFTIEYFLRSIDGISDNDDFWHSFFNAGLIDATSNSKQFHLHTCYECCMINCFDERMVG